MFVFIFIRFRYIRGPASLRRMERVLSQFFMCLSSAEPQIKRVCFASEISLVNSNWFGWFFVVVVRFNYSNFRMSMVWIKNCCTVNTPPIGESKYKTKNTFCKLNEIRLLKTDDARMSCITFHPNRAKSLFYHFQGELQRARFCAARWSGHRLHFYSQKSRFCWTNDIVTKSIICAIKSFRRNAFNVGSNSLTNWYICRAALLWIDKWIE